MNPVDTAFYTGVGLIGYSAGGTLGAGLSLVASALVLALLQTPDK